MIDRCATHHKVCSRHLTRAHHTSPPLHLAAAHSIRRLVHVLSGRSPTVSRGAVRSISDHSLGILLPLRRHHHMALFAHLQRTRMLPMHLLPSCRDQLPSIVSPPRLHRRRRKRILPGSGDEALQAPQCQPHYTPLILLSKHSAEPRLPEQAITLIRWKQSRYPGQIQSRLTWS